ncbi:hypothetical protein J5N97_029341 [Dioscorea zingiberensis]|uniref:Uncharacterized protein n=1 Tax=Dioscorea zingiberensis TaxID=325984 RepID=A0A9D5H5I9_9LILI|nr:hypothetical protein J5N97_029341 [Dioscorea zingiberensis]
MGSPTGAGVLTLLALAWPLSTPGPARQAAPPPGSSLARLSFSSTSPGSSPLASLSSSASSELPNTDRNLKTIPTAS